MSILTMNGAAGVRASRLLMETSGSSPSARSATRNPQLPWPGSSSAPRPSREAMPACSGSICAAAARCSTRALGEVQRRGADVGAAVDDQGGLAGAGDLCVARFDVAPAAEARQVVVLGAVDLRRDGQIGRVAHFELHHRARALAEQALPAQERRAEEDVVAPPAEQALQPAGRPLHQAGQAEAQLSARPCARLPAA
jgi:hypothetical protein